jgi:hypothetical protein
LDHDSIALLVTTIMGNKKNRVGGVVRPRPRGILARNFKELPCMVATLLTDGNDIPPIDREAKWQRTKAESLRKGSSRMTLKVRSSNEGIRKSKAVDHKVKKLVTKLAKIMNGVLLKARDVEAQRDVVAKLMDFDLLKKSIPPYILQAKEAKVQAEIIENIRIHLNVASHAKTKDHRVAKHVTLRMVVSGHGGNVSTMARVLGIHCNNVFDAVQRCHHVLDDGGCLDVIWAPLTKKIKSNKRSEDVVDVVT